MRHLPLPRAVRLSVALGVVLALAMPGVASADPPARFTETTLSVECPLVVTEDGAMGLFAFTSDLGFSEVSLVLFAEEPTDPEEFPLLNGFTDQAVVTGLTVEATVPLADEFGAEVGSATLNATLVPIGEPEPFEQKDPHFRVEGSSQAAEIQGTVVIVAEGILDGPATFDLASCFGNIFIQTVFQVNPGTIQDRHDEVSFGCELTNEDASVSLQGFSFVVNGEPNFGFISAVVSPNDPSEPMLFGGAETAFGSDGVDTSFEFFDELTGDILGTGTLSATFEPIGVEVGTRTAQDYMQKIVATMLAVSGTFTAETATATYEFDLGACEATYLQFHGIFHSPEGPKPGAAVPVNDTPEGALALEIGDRIRMQTGGASLAPEASCFIERFGSIEEAPMGRTVWFTVDGTGGPITIDPTGSNFDTLVGAYVAGESGLEQVACVDDDFSSLIQPPQTPLTFDSEVGTTYYIQVAGFDTGTLFGDEPNPEFGLLKLAVR